MIVIEVHGIGNAGQQHVRFDTMDHLENAFQDASYRSELFYENYNNGVRAGGENRRYLRVVVDDGRHRADIDRRLSILDLPVQFVLSMSASAVLPLLIEPIKPDFEVFVQAAQ